MTPANIHRRRRSLVALQRVWNLIGIAVALLILDLAAGWAHDAILGRQEAGGTQAIAISVGEGGPGAGGRPEFQSGTIPADDLRLTGSHWEDVSWGAEYFWDFEHATTTAYPFTENRPNALRTRYINIQGWERTSYQTETTGELPVVWFFGGSTMFGLGQRDEYTIASEIARIAEEEGTPVAVRNFGQPVWVNWQEMMLYEQLLATEPTPEFAVFYDGINDVNAQRILATDVPSNHFFNTRERQNENWIDPAAWYLPEPELPLLERAEAAYKDQSALFRAFRRLVPPASAQSDEDPWRTPRNQAEAAALAQRAYGIYTRGRSLISLMSADRAVTPIFYWQPQGLVDAPWFDEARALVDEPTIDLSDVLDGRDVYYDSMHTVEEGARLVAEAQWETLGPQVREWYRTNG